MDGQYVRNRRFVGFQIDLTGEWKKSDIGWRASSWYALRQGVKFEPLPAEEKKTAGLTRTILRCS
jgi:hypothetical protein